MVGEHAPTDARLPTPTHERRDLMTRFTPAFGMPGLALAALLSVTACGGEADHNDADVEFATGMIPHHEQAVAMADLALEQGGPEVETLAEEIQAAQGPEIETMTGWLESWGEEVPEDMDHMEMDGMDHSGMDGMMTPEQMEDLENAEGGEFDTLWLEMMIEHHEGAIAMSEDQVADGQNADAIGLAEDIAEAQQAEITQMQEMLRTDG